MNREGGRSDMDKPDIITDELETTAFKLLMMLKDMPDEPELIQANLEASKCLKNIVRYFTRQQQYLESLEE